MMLRTHQAAGALAAALYLASQHVPALSAAGALGLCAGYLAAPLPDVDNPNSVPARVLAPLAWGLETARVAHRTLTHSVWVVAALWFLVQRAHGAHLDGVALYPILMAAWIGVASHPAVDLLTKAGVPLFWPLAKKWTVHLAWFTADGPWDRVWHAAFLAALLPVVVYWGAPTTPVLQHVLDLAHRAWSVVPVRWSV